MKGITVFSITLLFLISAAAATAQDTTAVEQQVEALRAQLRDVTEKEAQLRERSRQLDEDLRPENIQRSVATIGTTDVVALRDQRRQQLERQKANVDQQLDSLGASRLRLESAIATAEAEVVRLRAAALAPTNAPARTETAGRPLPPAVKPAAQKKRAAPQPIKRVKRSKPRRRVRSQ